MQSFCDLETDQMQAARFGQPDPANTPCRTLPRESWLDRLARKLAPIPVDHVPIVPRHAASVEKLASPHRRPQCC